MSALHGTGPLAVVVTLGTDHHPFARLVEWVDAWAAAHPESPCVVQYGTAPAPRHVEGHQWLDPADIPGLMARAKVAVGHAGPGTVLDARAAGRLPILVPRRGGLGEVVDDHQVTFGRWMASRSCAVCVEDEADLHHHIDRAQSHPDDYALDEDDDGVPPSVALLGDLIDGLLAR